MAIQHLVWLRNDLRWWDNPALYFASTEGPIRVVITLTHQQWQQHNESSEKTGLRLALIDTLSSKLATLGIPVDILDAGDFQKVPDALEAFCLKNEIRHLWLNADIPIHERQRDQQVYERLKKHAIHCHIQNVDLVVPQPVLNQQNAPYKVFTPFYKQWLSLLEQQDMTPLPEPVAQGENIKNVSLHSQDKGFRDDLWPADQEIATQKLWHFCHAKENQYVTNRDYPSLPATSTLSPYLALGALGPRQCLEALRYVCEQEGRFWKESTWLKELAWRDFYRQLMRHFPHIVKGLPFKRETSTIVWNQNPTHLQAWQEGNTGFPIVDAAMRQLNQTGWMHNRLRMISASFFCKLLFQDWRKGEAYFMSKLIDGEFAANNGGWQWSASTGCDAAPYFRIFNPTRQSQNFDKNGEFIRRFVPELAVLDSSSIHNPSTIQRQECHYPEPIVDYKSARLSAISLFESI